jgi:hypothetical protein
MGVRKKARRKASAAAAITAREKARRKAMAVKARMEKAAIAKRVRLTSLSQSV